MVAQQGANRLLIGRQDQRKSLGIQQRNKLLRPIAAGVAEWQFMKSMYIPRRERGRVGLAPGHVHLEASSSQGTNDGQKGGDAVSQHEYFFRRLVQKNPVI